MKVKVLLCLSLLLGISFINSCTKDKKVLPVGPLTNCDTLITITYTNFVKGLLESSCTLSGCHDAGAPDGFDYTTYSGIKEKVENGAFQDRVLGIGRDMPSSLSTGTTSLDPCTLYKLQKWIKMGAPL